jgi:hypothetical protein
MRSRALGSVLALATVVGGVVAASPAFADGPPYNDPTASGSITLCDQDLQPITSGSITDRPSIWRAVGAQSAPAPYDGPERKASLFLFQPRKGVDPGEWTGTPVTAASTYTNADHPMAQSTVIDYALTVALEAYPPRWDGWMQLRLLYSVPNNPISSEYAAANIQVRGDTWRLVDGGNAPCDAGDAVSPEIALPYYSASAKAVLRQQQRQEAKQSASATPQASPTQTPSANGSATGGGDAVPQAAGSDSPTSGWSLVGWALAVVAIAGLATLTATYLIRRRETTADGRHR